MAEIKWIKLSTALFDNRKIKQIRKMPDGDALIVIWMQLLCLAGQINASGLVYFSKDIPYTEEMLATEFDRPLNTIKLALTVFQQFKMIEIVDNIFLVSNWEKYQSADKLEKIREQNRLRKQKQRAILSESHVTGHANVTQCHATDIDIDKDIDIEEDKENIYADKSAIPYQEIANLYLSICKSYPTINKLSDARKKAIKARLASGYTVEDFECLFKLAEESEFLKGKNDRNWQATFDWLIKDANMAKVLDGNYSNKKKEASKKLGYSSFDLSEVEKMIGGT